VLDRLTLAATRARQPPETRGPMSQHNRRWVAQCHPFTTPSQRDVLERATSRHTKSQAGGGDTATPNSVPACDPRWRRRETMTSLPPGRSRPPLPHVLTYCTFRPVAVARGKLASLTALSQLPPAASPCSSPNSSPRTSPSVTTDRRRVNPPNCRTSEASCSRQPPRHHRAASLEVARPAPR
jgi:hypothetical protein